jgi:hypothetical protein
MLVVCVGVPAPVSVIVTFAVEVADAGAAGGA